MTDNDQIPQVLVVDDELNIRELVQVALKFYGCSVTTAATGKDALRQANADRPDLIVLDVMLPDIDGFEVCRRLRAMGKALVARVRAVLRRASRGPDGGQAGGDGATLRAGDVELDEARWTVRRAGVPIELSPTEFRLLAFLIRHQGQVLTRAQLLENVWGWDYAGESQIVETYVSYLRRKLDPLGPPMIHTQRGVGYSLRPPDRGQAAPG